MLSSTYRFVFPGVVTKFANVYPGTEALEFSCEAKPCGKTQLLQVLANYCEVKGLWLHKTQNGGCLKRDNLGQ